MSLINDALKRAKQSQKEAPVIHMEPPPLRPADPSPQPGLWPFLGIPVVLAVVLALAVIFFWRWLDQIKPQPIQVAARTVLPNPTAANTAPVAPRSVKLVAPTAKATARTDDAANALAAINSTASATTSATSNTIVAAAEPPPVPPAPPPLKLQGIFYTRKNPSAVINGKIRTVGDRIGEAQLLAIGPESVSVVVAGKTNELTLP
jgi:hypothetical protein